MLRLAGLQLAGLGECLQLLLGLVGLFAVGCRGVELHDLPAGMRTGVGYLDVDLDSLAVARYDGLRVFEGGVREAVAEGIRHLLAECVEVAVADVYVLLVFGEVDVSYGVLLGAAVGDVDVGRHVDGEVARRGGILEHHGECHRELARGRSLACQHVGDAVAALLSRLPCAEYGVGQLLPRCGLDHAADV